MDAERALLREAVRSAARRADLSPTQTRALYRKCLRLARGAERVSPSLLAAALRDPDVRVWD